MIYICIPAHNEEQTVGVVLWKIRQVMAEFPRDYQLLVVDDASTDKTPDVLAPYARVLPLTVVRPDRRRGPADAVEMMLREAVRRSEYPKRDIVVTLQADFTQEPDELVGLIKRMEAGADIVVGQPMPSPETPRAVHWGRRLAQRLLGRRLVPEGVTDPFMGYTAYRVFTLRRALEEANGRLVHWGGWAGAAELLAAAAPHARRIEALDMMERRERLQRPSRLQVWPALKAVWALARGALPVGLAEPAELDQAMRSVAARRTSELALAPRERTPRQERGEGSQRTTRRRGSTEERGRERRPRGERPERPERRPREDRPARPAGERNGRRRNGRPAVPGTAPSDAPAEERLPLALEEVAGEMEAPEAGAEPARRKRSRRRRRTGSAESAAPQGGDGEEVVAPAAGEEADAGAEAAGSEGATRARRRRRGRRGGRRRSGGATTRGTESSTESEAAQPAVEIREPEAQDEPISHD